ncbi:uncharacterized protein LOC107825619 [Nicotiana tabacum]|uniref:Uncharacterized protein LOC107825619 n=2 Tax=Nicotiana TaxID=4085 RepID=A0A1S4D3S3_TOBAC|nr:PREDICTED: uncharacterized protein LOC104227050 [Nicotiana sylvestris]XP_016507983.1 PREDICTED: uncharacterized protein LOC107825619 [Nicotiana tabacum]
MQRWCTKLRSLAVLRSTPNTHHPLPYRLLTTATNPIHRPFTRTLFSSSFTPISHGPISFPSSTHSSLLPSSFTQVRYITAKQKKRKLKSRKPMTPVTSKVKKIKMKFYSSYKDRFRVMKDGLIRRWREGKRHNAHLKSKKSKRRLRQPATVPLAYAKVMKKLNFCG